MSIDPDIAAWLKNSPDLVLDDPYGELAAAPKAPRPRQERERELQKMVFLWRDAQICFYDDLRYLYASLNGQYAGGGRVEAGLTAGVPDLNLPLPRRGYTGLWIELKAGKNTPSDDQARWVEKLNSEGAFACFIWDDLHVIIDLIVWYLEGAVGIGHQEQYSNPKVVRKWKK